MYSVILMATLTTGGEIPAFCHGRGRHGCYGCTGCNGGCHGCYGGCHGCYGGCHGCSGCYGGCHGCHGGWGPYVGVGDFGYGCWGYGCNGCAGYYACYGAWTCYGNFGCTGAPYVISPGPIVPQGPEMGDRKSNNNGGDKEAEKNPEKKGEMPEDKTNKNKKGEKDGTGSGDIQLMSLSPDRARLIVTLPADAKLYVDGQQMKTPSERRVFHTPQLAPGQYYYYNLRAELVRDGRTITHERRVVVRGGSVTQTSFTDMPDDGPTITVQR